MYTKYTGIILKKYPLGEADELLTIYTREAGKLRAKAVSSRKIKSRLGGHLQTLNEIDFETAGQNLPILISARSRTLNNYLRQNLKKFAYALVGIETLYRLTPDEEPNQKLYEALVNFLGELGRSVNENLEVRRFQLKLLEVSGYGMPKARNEGGVTPERERQIDEFLNYILERELKSKRFLRTLRLLNHE